MTPLRSTSLSVSILSLALGLGACVDENADSGLIILHAVPPESGCTFAAGGTAIQPSGRIQSTAGNGYLIAPEVRNDLTLADGEAESPKTILISGARVEIQFRDPSPFTDAEEAALATEGLTRFEAPFAGSVAPNGGTAVLPFEAVPVQLLRRIDAKLPDPTFENPSPSFLLDVQIRELGTRRGDSVESNLFRFPVEVCADCLIRDLGQCVDLSSAQTVSTGGACQTLQDGVLDCCHGVDPDGPEGPAGQPFVCPAARPQL